MNLAIHPVTEARWSDLEQLFESRGGPHNCWCMAWRVTESANSESTKVGKKAELKKRVYSAVPIGLLAYSNNAPIAWCSIAPRDSYRPLGGKVLKEEVWSLTCFFVKREFRNLGLSRELLHAAIKYAKENGAKYVEAYPVGPDSPSYRFMGFKPTFEREGFDYIKMAGSRRNVMLLELV